MEMRQKLKQKQNQAGSRSCRILQAMIISLSFILSINKKPQKDFKERVTHFDLHFKRHFVERLFSFKHVLYAHTNTAQSKYWPYHSKIWIQHSVIVGEKIF